jgi:hypothetical protein
MKTGTTPALVPPQRKNARAKAAGPRQERGSRTLRARATSSQGSRAYGCRIGVVAPATTTYGLATYTVAAATRPGAPASGATDRTSLAAPQAATASSSARHSRTASQASAPTPRMTATTAAAGAVPASKFGCPRYGSGRQAASDRASARPGARYSSGLVSGVNHPRSVSTSTASTPRPSTP